MSYICSTSIACPILRELPYSNTSKPASMAVTSISNMFIDNSLESERECCQA